MKLPYVHTESPDLNRLQQKLAAALEPALAKVQAIAGRVLHPTTPSGAPQGGALYMGVGAPSNGDGLNGDFYDRTDGTHAAGNTRYHKEAGVWVALGI